MSTLIVKVTRSKLADETIGILGIAVVTLVAFTLAFALAPILMVREQLERRGGSLIFGSFCMLLASRSLGYTDNMQIMVPLGVGATASLLWVSRPDKTYTVSQLLSDHVFQPIPVYLTSIVLFGTWIGWNSEWYIGVSFTMVVLLMNVAQKHTVRGLALMALPCLLPLQLKHDVYHTAFVPAVQFVTYWITVVVRWLDIPAEIWLLGSLMVAMRLLAFSRPKEETHPAHPHLVLVK